MFANDTDFLIRQTFTSDECRLINVLISEELNENLEFDALILSGKLENQSVLSKLNNLDDSFQILLGPNIEFDYSPESVKQIRQEADNT